MNHQKKIKLINAVEETASKTIAINGTESDDYNIFEPSPKAVKNNTVDLEEKTKILGYSTEIFLREGFYKTSMDEIASRLHMSKKTIYKNFPSKEDLVKDVMRTHLHFTIKRVKEHINKESSAVQKMFDIFTIVGENILKVNEKMIMDLQFYSPEIWKEVDDFRTKQINHNLARIFEQGKAEGCFLNIKTEIILSVFVASIRSIVNPDFARKCDVSLQEAFLAIIEILMNGIMNEKGKKIFNKLKNGVTK
jgi:AcrR family transcriptional regulator